MLSLPVAEVTELATFVAVFPTVSTASLSVPPMSENMSPVTPALRTAARSNIFTTLCMGRQTRAAIKFCP